MPSNNNVCRFCLQLVHHENVELINEATLKILGLLLIKLDLDVSEDPVKCNNCSGILDQIYMFKSHCLYSEDIISAHFKSNLKGNLMDILKKLKNEPDINVAEDEVVCRLCMKIPPNGSFIVLNKTGEEVSRCRDMIQMQLPEIDLSITEEPIICDACHVQLKNYSCFATNCVDVEEKIKIHCEHRGSDLKNSVDLLCVLQFTENKAKDCEKSFYRDLVIKNEDISVLKVEKVEEFEKDSLSSSSTEFYIKEEEIEIKSEGDQISCYQDTLSTQTEDYLLGHKNRNRRNPKVALHCNQCNFRTKHRSSLCLHKKAHDPTMYKLKCDHCEYSTFIPTRLREHLVTHMMPGETAVYRCTTCEFKSKYKNSCRDHMTRCLKKKGEDDTGLKIMLRCSQCSFCTRSTSSLRRHQNTHDPARQKIKCEYCEFSTYPQSKVKEHLVTHMELGETEVYYCATCKFKSKYKGSLASHVKRCLKKKEKDDMDSRATLQCNQCDFHTKSQNFMYKHKKTHNPDKHKFVCQQCEYWSYYSTSLNQHLVTHMDMAEAVAYYCATCDFQTKYKSSLRDHVKRCLKKNQCDFRPKSKTSLY